MAKNKLKMNKFLTGAVTATMVATAVVPMASANVAAAKEFSDVPATDAHYQNIMQAVERGLFNGYADGTFKPYRDLSRGNVAKVLANYVVSQDGSADYAAYIEKHDLATNVKAFSDVSSTHSDKELFNASLIVKDAKIFDGSNNNLMPTKTISRQQMAKVLVKGFGLQDLPGDLSKVTDNSKAFAEFVPYINILSENGVTTETSFKPGSKVKRAQMASFLNRSFDIAKGALAPAVKSVKAINATTVEVTMKEKAENIGTFTIEGLTVSNAAVKQSDDKVVVLTTAVQEGGKKYTVKIDGDTIGTFDGVSAVIPTKIDLVKSSTQGKVGQQIVLSADVGVKQAGIPVTFNVKASDQLNKDQVFESLTDANGIATFSYTQYSEGRDQVVAYPTGAPTVRDLGYVFWGVDTILTVEDVTEGAAINNGANKTYKVKYLDPKTGKPVAGKRFAVSFEENINVNVNQLSKAKVNNVNPSQLLNGTAPQVAVVITDAKGEATFTVSGENTAVTPIVFEQAFTSNTANATVWSNEYKTDVLQTTASKVTFGAVQADYKIALKRDGSEEAAKGLANGREYTMVVTDKDGKVAKNETVNVAFNEDLDGVIGTETAAQFIKEDAAGNPYYATKQITVVTDAKGEASFVIGSEIKNDYATPIAWIDVNSAYANEGKLDKGEASIIGDISYFADAKLAGAALTTYNEAGTKTKSIDASQSAEFKVALTNQSGKSIKLADVGYSHIVASFTVYNTGANVIEVDGQKVSPNRSHTVPAASADSIKVKSVDGKSTSVRVVANGVAKAGTTGVLDYNFTSSETTATFTATTDVADLHTGVVASYHSGDKTIKFAGKDAVKYAGAAGYTYKYFGGNGAQLSTAATFITELTKGGTAVVTYKVDADKLVTFNIVSIDTTAGATGKPVDTNVPAGPTATGVLTMTSTAATPSTTLVDVSGTKTETLTVSLGDADLNVSKTAIDTATVALTNGTNPALTLTLVETGVDTGVFTTTVQTGTLKSLTDGTLTVIYADAKNVSGVAQTVTKAIELKTLTGALSGLAFTQANLASDATAAVYTTRSIDPTFLFTTGDSISLVIDAGSATPVSLAGKTGAQGVADAINTAALGATATVAGDKVVITSNTTGLASKANVTASNIAQILVGNATGANANGSLIPATQALTISTALVAGEKVTIGNESYALVAASDVLQATELVLAINNNSSSAYTALQTGTTAAVVLTAKATTTITAPAVKVTK